jgi:hypothetical protein
MMFLSGGNTMWLFKKKEASKIELPPLPGLQPQKSDEIELLPEEEMVPEELPPLEVKMQMPSQESRPQPIQITMPVAEQRAVRAQKPTRELIQRFLKTDDFQSVVLELNGISNDFDTMDYEIERIVELKTIRNQKIDGLQSTLEDVSKKLIFVENTLFGG